MIQPPEHIQSIKPYIPGKPVKELERELGITGSIKLASNENPSGPSPLAVRALRKSLGSLNRYPEGSCYYLGNKLSERLGIGNEEILFGNGSNELIELAVRTFLSPGDEAITAHPSFVVYSTTVQAALGKNIIVPLTDWRHDLDAMASKITEKTRLIFIANPNNPTGTINTAAEMDSFMKRVPDGVLVVVDEAYYEYVDAHDYPDSLKFMREGKNVLVLRTFSKIYGLSGLRIGYGIAPSGIITEMNKVRQPFNVNTPAQYAALAALDDEAHIDKTRRLNERGKKYLYRKFDSLGLGYLPTHANFIYVSTGNKKSQELYNDLLREGIIIRPAGPDAVRITIGLPGENRILAEKLEKIIQKSA